MSQHTAQPPTIKPIETLYKGYRFRSRLEARWAVFFDRLRFQWEYEPEGFVLPDGTPYLPDFRVTSPQGLVAWYEVKPLTGGTPSKMPAMAKASRTEQSVTAPDSDPDLTSFETIEGDPVDFLANGTVCPRCGLLTHGDDPMEVNGSVYYECYPCDMTTPCGDGNDDFEGILPGVWVEPYKGLLRMSAAEYAAFKEITTDAAQDARMARFEHGERP